MSLSNRFKKQRSGGTKGGIGERIAFGGIGAAISLLAVTAAFYVPNVSVAFNVLASLGVMLPLTKRFYREAVLVVVATTGIGAIYTTVHILPFLLMTGSYTIFAIISYEKQIKLWITMPVCVFWSSFVFCVLYYLTKILYVDLDVLRLSHLSKGLLYFIFNLIFTCLFVIYHFGIIWVFKYLGKLVSKIKIGKN